MTRPDYIKCIADTRADKKHTTLCKKECYDFMFVDIDHAFYSHLNESRFVVCVDCAVEVKAAFDEMFIESLECPDEIEDIKE